MKLEDEPPYCLGLTIYKTQNILLLKNQANIIRTLKHELTHVWLYEYAHIQSETNTYCYEEVCEIVSKSNDFINEIVNQYFRVSNKCKSKHK